jgi:hypothetical protein
MLVRFAVRFANFREKTEKAKKLSEILSEPSEKQRRS